MTDNNQYEKLVDALNTTIDSLQVAVEDEVEKNMALEEKLPLSDISIIDIGKRLDTLQQFFFPRTEIDIDNTVGKFYNFRDFSGTRDFTLSLLSPDLISLIEKIAN